MPLLTTSQAQTNLKQVWSEAASLTPTSLITLFEIDYGDLATDQGLVLNPNDEKIFRFHNNLGLTTRNLYYQNKIFVATPIKAEGFEINGRGTLPTPKLSITVDETGLRFFGLFKDRLKQLGDLVGAKVTRIRTFAKYLDAKNWGTDIPIGFEPPSDPSLGVEMPRDVYYIDRKSAENKFTMEFELASIFDVENIMLPGRMIFAKRCMFHYRGEGCLYEYNDRFNEDVHGIDAILPDQAPPVATDKDELITTIIGSNVPITSPTLYDANKLSSYRKGNSVYITKNNLNYYFVCKSDAPLQPPPHLLYWAADQCSKILVGCRLRWGSNGAVGINANTNLVKGQLPFGGFPAADKVG